MTLQDEKPTNSIFSSILNLALEGVQAIPTWGTTFVQNYKPGILHSYNYDADKPPVLIIPGFMMNDFLMEPLHQFLRTNGFRTKGSGIKLTNAFVNENIFNKIERSLFEITEKTGQKAIVVGHSLGGNYTLELTKRYPDYIEKGITLGSPLVFTSAIPDQHSLIRQFFHAVHSKSIDYLTGNNFGPDVEFLSKATYDAFDLTEIFLSQLSNIPFTSFYSATDQIVYVDQTQIPESLIHKNVELPPDVSHTNMFAKPSVLDIILQELTML